MTCACGKPAVYTGTGECMGCYRRRHRQENPEAAERDRRGSRDWKERHRDANRARDREYSRARRKPCPRGCGGICKIDSDRCIACARADAEERRGRIIAMYEAGVPLAEMAVLIGSTVPSIGVDLDRLRKAGRVGRRYRKSEA